MEKQQKTHPVLSVKDVLLIILGALLLIVIFQNVKAQEYRIFFWKLSLAPVLLSLIMAGAGFLAGWLVARRCYKNKAAKAAAAPPPPPSPPAPVRPPSENNRPLA